MLMKDNKQKDELNENQSNDSSSTQSIDQSNDSSSTQSDEENSIDQLTENFKNSFIKAKNINVEIDSAFNRTLHFTNLMLGQSLKFFSCKNLVVFISCKINKLLTFGCVGCTFIIKSGVVSGIDIIHSEKIRFFMKGYETYNIDMSFSNNISIRIEKYVIKHLMIYNIGSLDNELIFFTCGENVLSSNIVHKTIKLISSLIDNFYVYHLVNQKDIYVLNSYSYNIHYLLGTHHGMLYESNVC
jgi:hypothetical protein